MEALELITLLPETYRGYSPLNPSVLVTPTPALYSITDPQCVGGRILMDNLGMEALELITLLPETYRGYNPLNPSVLVTPTPALYSITDPQCVGEETILGNSVMEAHYQELTTPLRLQ